MTARLHDRGGEARARHGVRPAPRGFTLVEIMVTVAIVGLLSSIAVPQYGRMTSRARAAEREAIMTSVRKAIDQTIGDAQAVPGGTWTGVDNPAGTPGAAKRVFDPRAPGWSQLPLVIEGATYHTYSFEVLDPDGHGNALAVRVTSMGDLDGDGVQSVRTDAYVGLGYALVPDPEPEHWVVPDDRTF